VIMHFRILSTSKPQAKFTTLSPGLIDRNENEPRPPPMRTRPHTRLRQNWSLARRLADIVLRGKKGRDKEDMG
jgi:hypothetical protein